MDILLLIAAPTGDSQDIKDKELPVDLILLNMSDFDIILGMD